MYKQGGINKIGDNRPITIINNLFKVFEISLHGSIFSHAKNVVTSHQHGFMKHRSTVTNFIVITQSISSAIDNHLHYNDFSKDCDKLDHGTLLTTVSFGKM